MKPMKHHRTLVNSGRPPFTEAERTTLDHYESAARAECLLMDFDPMEEVTVKHPTIQGANVSLHRWETKVAQLEIHDIRMQALLCTAADRQRRDATAVTSSALASSQAVASTVAASSESSH